MKIYFTRKRVESRDFLQTILHDYYQIERPQIVTGKYGKPRLEAGTPCFNLSHSGTITAVAVDEREVGLDIQLRTQNDYSAVKNRLSPEEREEDFFRETEEYVLCLCTALPCATVEFVEV